MATSALAQTPQGASLLPGSSSKEPINIAADKLDYFDKDQKAVYSGNVVVVQGDTRLNASVLTIVFDRKSDSGKKPGQASSNSQLKSMKGNGPITIVNKDQIGVGDNLEYDKVRNRFSLIGNVTLSQGENVTKGDELVYDLQTGQAVVSSRGRVKSRIVPGDKPGQPSAPSPKPSAGQ
ncbi:lipopolysaccharide transport periplasmic protein LptA [Rhodoblastus acidophilus]|uniref:Lipopolysaccharide transport periplasmic protein LptA n=1 Tax=Rhodoblastus acidophilus TaxID=1074 RepID=A0A6N8DJK1_RHOAC|nr:lipopolysaccharide transport periplasmic protein LptA [Rhodoblastus acidophilus]MCW2274045.1 lipopolysaccharide export system protein LptA [Rhodoblastus acidophilus]MTV30619.1 lipopolysaccharide transport periplasmic protein LptA [Rhodoblastus acidophilus]